MSPCQMGSGPNLVARARALIAVKRSIASSHGLNSSDPVHDILMELYVADHENRPMSVSAAAVMAGLALTDATKARIDAVLGSGAGRIR